jgi:beta-galactosidase
MLEAGHLKGTAIGLDSGSNEGDFKEAEKADSMAPAFSSETYPGWLTHWGENGNAPIPMISTNEVEFLLKNKNQSILM